MDSRERKEDEESELEGVVAAGDVGTDSLQRCASIDVVVLVAIKWKDRRGTREELRTE